jgi:hypothetical protein
MRVDTVTSPDGLREAAQFGDMEQRESMPGADLDERLSAALATGLRDAFAGGGKVGYTYDFGASWEHEVTLEKTLALEAGRKYPVCVAFRADSPVEYWSGDEDEEDAAEPEPFDLAEVNKRLSAQG